MIAGGARGGRWRSMALPRCEKERGTIVKKPETTSSEDNASPGNDSRKTAAPGPVIDVWPLPSDAGATPASPEPKPPVESALVGAGGGPGAAAPKADATKADPGKPGAESSLPASVPPVGGADGAKSAPTAPDAAKSDAVKSGAGKPEPAKPEAAKPEAAKAEPAKPQAAKPVPAKAEPVKPEPVRVETREVVVRKGGFMPTFLGGVVAAGLGAAATWWAIPHLPPEFRPGLAQAPAPEIDLEAARAAATEAARAEVQTQAEALATRAAEAGADAARQALADAPPPPAADDGGLLKAAQDKLAALEKTVSDLAARPAAVVSGEGGTALQGVIDDLSARLSAQQTRLEELTAGPAAAVTEQAQNFAAQAEALQARITAAAEEAQARISAAESQASELQATAEAANLRARAATAAAALQAALESGGPREQALADLRAAGVEPPAVLTAEVPTLAQLRADFPAAARAGLAAALEEAPAEEGALGAITNFLRVQTGARSVEPREGSDADAILSRVDASVEAGDIRGALEGIGTLSQAGQAAMSGWTGKAQTWLDANAALAALAAGSL